MPRGAGAASRRRPVEAGTLEQTAESLARTRLWGLDCAAEVKIWRRPL